MVQKTLQGKQDELKERMIGIEAFGRSPEYDLNDDPIVRVTAGEVRKRLAQYYYEVDQQAELRIELHSGSYVPDFKYIRGDTFDAAEASSEELTAIVALNKSMLASAPSEPPAGRRRHRIMVWSAVSVLLALLLSGAVGIYMWTRDDSAFGQFWEPVLNSPNPVLICVGSPTLMNVPSPNVVASSVGGHALSSNPVAMADALAIARFQQVLLSHSRQNNIQSYTDVTFSDLQKGPVILVSAFDNPWTMRLTDSLRYHFVRSALDTYEIEDHFDPMHRRWAIYTLTPFTHISHDYGLVARYHDPSTGQIIVVAAGIGENGTLEASEMLTDQKYLGELRTEHVLPQRYQNMEAVIETEMIDGKPGPPHILAVHTW